jgi:hypothetical protein
MQLGHGYWSLMAVERRISKLLEKKPRRWNKKLKALRQLRKQILALPKTDKLVKGWRSHDARKDRAMRMRELHRTKSFTEIGREFGISRQRVHQIVHAWE